MKKLFTSLFIYLFMIGMASAQNSIVISEIMYNPPESGDDSLEYYEIANTSGTDYSLAGHIMTSGVVDSFGVNDVVPAHGFFVSAKKASSFNIVFGFLPHQWKSGSLNNGGETLTLSNGAGGIVATVAFGDSGLGWVPEADGEGPSMELCDLSGDVNAPSSWGIATTGTGIIVNGYEVFGSPGTDNTAECGSVVDPNTVIVANFQFTPADITINEGESVKWKFEEGMHNVNGNQNIFPANPESFRSGEPADAPYEYSHQFNIPGDYDYHCDPHAPGMKGKVHVIAKPPAVTYPIRTIGQVDDLNVDGGADSLGKKCEVSGIIYGVNMRASGLSSTIIDGARDGIGIFNPSKTFGYTVKESDNVTIRGTVDQFNGLTQILIDTIWVNSTNASLHDAREVLALDESAESDLVVFTDMSLKTPSEWVKGSTFNATITNGSIDVLLRVVNTTTLSAQDAPVGTFSVKGIGGQFDSSSPYTEGYQLLPRRKEDLDLFASTKVNDIAKQVDIYPSPAQNDVFIRTSLKIKQIEVIDAQGRVLTKQLNQLNSVNISALSPGAYWLKITTIDGSGVKSFQKI